MKKVWDDSIVATNKSVVSYWIENIKMIRNVNIRRRLYVRVVEWPHAAVNHRDFECKLYADPTSPRHIAARAYLKKYLLSASFDMYWKLVPAFDPLVLKAMTSATIISAAVMAGFDGDTINVDRILSHNREFVEQPPHKAYKIVGLVWTVFTSYWWNHGLIHEYIVWHEFKCWDCAVLPSVI